ncbi:MAG: nicotinamidase [Deltaproteobacteria bacterium]|nr:nicotinamidase [Deltaproteobacteria bacterium]
MKLAPELPLPESFDAALARDARWSPDQQLVFESARELARAHAIAPAHTDAFKVHLLLIDVQKDFCFPSGSLYVGGRSGTGAMDDNARLAQFMHKNLARITETTCTLDTHLPFQIFFPSFWEDQNGRAPGPHRAITTDDLRSGRIRVNPEVASFVRGGDHAWLAKQVLHYCDALERAGRYTLWLWPPHCLLGSDGHALAGIVHEARLMHAFARQMQAWVEPKGSHPLTENYSVFSPEVLTEHDGGALATCNDALVERLLRADAILVAGQAASHCVKSSVDDLLEAIQRRDPRLARKVYLLTDCMSAVTVPDGKGGFLADFTAQAEAALQRFADAGMHLVRSTEPMEAWLG